MASGLVAFADEAVAREWARDHRGRVMAFEDVLHDSTLLARLARPPGSGAGRAP
jgi:nitrous oxide reductase accessory protein NosL